MRESRRPSAPISRDALRALLRGTASDSHWRQLDVTAAVQYRVQYSKVMVATTAKHAPACPHPISLTWDHTPSSYHTEPHASIENSHRNAVAEVSMDSCGAGGHSWSVSGH